MWCVECGNLKAIRLAHDYCITQAMWEIGTIATMLIVPKQFKGLSRQKWNEHMANFPCKRGAKYQQSYDQGSRKEQHNEMHVQRIAWCCIIYNCPHIFNQNIFIWHKSGNNVGFLLFQCYSYLRCSQEMIDL